MQCVLLLKKTPFHTFLFMHVFTNIFECTPPHVPRLSTVFPFMTRWHLYCLFHVYMNCFVNILVFMQWMLAPTKLAPTLQQLADKMQYVALGQLNRLTLTLFWTTDRSDHNIRPMAHNSEQVCECMSQGLNQWLLTCTLSARSTAWLSNGWCTHYHRYCKIDSAY